MLKEVFNSFNLNMNVVALSGDMNTSIIGATVNY